MNELKNFLTPRLVGKRFTDHGIPLEVLKDFAVLEEMIVEVAKWHYLQVHQERHRSPRGFTDNISLKLTEIQTGSAIAAIAVSVEVKGFGLVEEENEHCFFKARDSIIAAIDAAEHDEQITNHLPEPFLGYFDRIGRSLRDDEGIEFRPKNPTRPATLNKTTRRKLTLASSKVRELTEEVLLRGRIPEVDQDKGHFTLQLYDGTRIQAPLETQHSATVIEAFNAYADSARVSVNGVGKFDRYGRLERLEFVEHLSLLDARDVGVRLDEFRLLRNGWLDGKGIAPAHHDLEWITKLFETNYPDDLPAPFLYPTAEGGVQAEWTIGGHEISLEIIASEHRGEWHDLNVESQEDTDRDLNLDDPHDWQWIADQIRSKEGVSQ